MTIHVGTTIKHFDQAMTEEQVIEDEVQPSTSGIGKEGNSPLPIPEPDEKWRKMGTLKMYQVMKRVMKVVMKR